MKLASQTRPTRSLEPNRPPFAAVSSKGGTVPRTGSLGGTGVRRAQEIGHATMSAMSTTQVSGRPTAAPTHAWMRSRNPDRAAVGIAPIAFETDDQVPEASRAGKSEVRLERHGRARARAPDGGVAAGCPIRHRDTREDRDVDLPHLRCFFFWRPAHRRRHPLRGPPPVAAGRGAG